jgi:predicted outer membrane repeat protein
MVRLLQVTLAFVLVGGMLVGPASAAPADSVVGNGTPLSCTEGAFDNALSAGGTITFDCGGTKTITLTNAKSISQDTTLMGGDVIRLSGGSSTRLFIVDSGVTFKLEHILLEDAAHNGSDGGAVVNHGNLTLDHSTIEASQIDGNHSGGAIFSDGPLTITNSTLSNNIAGSGGALFDNLGQAVVHISDSNFSGNQALNATTGYGGAIWAGDQAQVAITGGVISHNQGQSGGGLYLSPGAMLTLGSSGAPAAVSTNLATFVGGGIALAAGAQLTMTGGSLDSNQAAAEGGALDMNANSSADFEPGSAGGTSISSNYAPDFGGAISNNGGSLSLEGANVSFNKTVTGTLSIGFGGAIDDDGAMVVDNSIFNTNLGRFGGAVFVGGHTFNAQADIRHTLFVANNAAQFGGALYANTVTTTVTIEDSNIEFNTAYFGGGLARFDAQLSVSKSSITNNAADFGGGLGVKAGPDASGAFVEIRDSTISGNLSTQGYGGGINNSGLLDLFNVTLADNHTAPLPPPDSAAGVYAVITGTVTRLQGTVLDNPGANCFAEFGAGAPTSAGFNYATDTTCSLSGFHDTQGDGLNAMLGTLTQNFNNNLFTNYQMPLPGSPLIDQDTGGCSPTDQIYALRRGACDIGAVEFDGLLPRIFAPLMQR